MPAAALNENSLTNVLQNVASSQLWHEYALASTAQWGGQTRSERVSLKVPYFAKFASSKEKFFLILLLWMGANKQF